MADAIYVPKSDILDLITEENEAGSFTDYSNYSNLWDEVDDMPASDVQPMKHGRWIDCTFYDPCEKSWEQDFEFECSNCGRKIYNKPNDDNLFCGHCGARMDGDSK